MESAMSGSIILELGRIYPAAVNPNEMLWAKVKTEH